MKHKKKHKKLITHTELEEIFYYDPNSYTDTFTGEDNETYKEKLERFEKETGYNKIHFKAYIKKFGLPIQRNKKI